MTLLQIWHKAREKRLHSIRRFMRDMSIAGLKSNLRYYKGRNFWFGPAVEVDGLQEALSHTTVKCQWDRFGMGYIVYPVQSLPAPE